ncbi:MAG: InlB B-repeat-containing protein [Clostridiales Family XIII bacterium]|jgi:uncharacterized repeat protein (TIGR02543 family)|nr:InlB B-repeat-containing protein [Clostridiales Family XIII bacterium]
MISNAPSRMTSLKRIYVPQASYSIYIAELSASLPNGIQLLSSEGSAFVIEDGILIYYTGEGGEVTIPADVTEIGASAFKNNKTVTKVNFPNGLESIRSGAFEGSGLTGQLNLPSSIERIGARAFYNCKNLSGDLIIPDSVVTLDEYAFYGCSGINGTLKLSQSMTSVAANTFQGCTQITGELIIPDSVIYISTYAFDGMTGLTSIIFGSGLVSIMGTNPFNNCSNIQEITFNRSIVPTNIVNIFASMNQLETIYIPADAVYAYKNAIASSVKNTVEFSYETINMTVKDVRADRIYSNTVRITWSKHADDTVAEYIVERDGTILGHTTGLSYTDKNLTTGTKYIYTVYGVTEAGRETGKSSITVTPAAPTVQNIYTDSEYNYVGVTNGKLYATAANTKNHLSIGDKKTVGKFYYIDVDSNARVLIGDAVLNEGTVYSQSVTYRYNWDIKDIPDGTYTVIFELTDADGAVAELSKEIIVDHSVPETIVNVLAIGDINGIQLSWGISSEVNTNRYRIYRRTDVDEDFYVLANVNKRETQTYSDTSVIAGKKYYYYVTGVNEFGQEGIPSETVVAVKGTDRENPVVTKLTPANGSGIHESVIIQLTAVDNVAPVRAVFSYSTDGGITWIGFGEDKYAPFAMALDTKTLPEKAILVRGIAYDLVGNESTPLIYTYNVDNTGPEKVTELSASAISTNITLRWHDVSDNDIAYFRVEQKDGNGNYAKIQDVTSTLGANISGLIPNTQYTYRVVGYDRLGNRGIPSDDITMATALDTAPPVITDISPKSGYYAQQMNLKITAADEYQVKSIKLQTSTDGTNWSDIFTQQYSDIQKKRQLSYLLDVANVAEGPLYIRAVASDAAGNESDTTEKAPFVQHQIDRTPPNAPAAVTASGLNGYIEIAWYNNSEEDLNAYAIYRAESTDGTYTKVKDGLKALNYFDRNVTNGTQYYYRVSAFDFAGNESAQSEVVSASMALDTEAPEVVNIYPVSNSAIGSGFKTVSSYVRDNRELESVTFEYALKGSSYTLLTSISSIHSHETSVSAQIPVGEFNHGDEVVVRVTARDTSGNLSAEKEAIYSVDTVAPVASEVRADDDKDVVTVSWNSNKESDLAGYHIYRKTGSGNYTMIAQLPAEKNKTKYSFVDRSISADKASYTYRIDAIDNVGNSSVAYSNLLEMLDRTAPTAVINCDSVMEVGVEYEIDASDSTDNTGITSYEFDLGDGTKSNSRKVIHKYTNKGEFTIQLTVTDEEGNRTTVSHKVTVRERALIGTATIHVVDENGSSVPNASVYFNMGNAGQVKRNTDNRGNVSFTADAGTYSVGCIIPDNEWLPSKKDIIINAGAETAVTMTMIHEQMIEGNFETKRMTFDEIVAAGIDINDPANQYIVNITVHLLYQQQPVQVYYNERTHETLGGTGWNGGTYYVINLGGGGGGSGSGGSGGGSGDGGFTTEVPNIAVAYIDIPVQVSTLKDFYDVKLHIFNNASEEFKMTDNVVSLNVPDGLTLMSTDVSEKKSTVSIPEIAGQSQKTIRWILRGDEIGKYDLSADYTGMLAEFNEPISARFETKEPIEVFGLTGLEARVDVSDTIVGGEMAYNLSLINNSDREVYLPNIGTPDSFEKAIVFASEHFTSKNAAKSELMDTGRVLLDEGLSTELPIQLQVLKPGEKMTRHYIYNDSAGEETLFGITGKLIDYYYDASNTYGLEINIVPRKPAYFGETPTFRELYELKYANVFVYKNLKAPTDTVDDFVLCKNTSVLIDGQEMTTNDSGSVRIEKKGKVAISVGLAGYVPEIFSIEELNQSTTPVYLHKDVEGYPVVHSLWAEGAENTRTNVYVNDYRLKTSEATATEFNAKMNWRGSNRQTLQLTQGSKVVAFDANDNLSTVVKDAGFDLYDVIYIQASSTNGKSIKKEIQLIGDPNEFGTFNVGFGPRIDIATDGGSDSSGLSTAANSELPILGGQKFALDLGDIGNLTVEVEGDTVKILGGVGVEESSKSKKDKKAFKKNYDIVKNAFLDPDNKKKANAVKKIMKNPIKKEVVVSMNFSAAVFFEFKMVNGSLEFDNGGIVASIEGGVDFTGPIITPLPIPFFWEASIRGELETELKLYQKSAGVDGKGGSILPNEGSVTFELQVRFGVGAGIPNILSVSGGGNGVLKFTHDFFPSGYEGNLAAALQVYVKLHILLFEHEWTENLAGPKVITSWSSAESNSSSKSQTQALESYLASILNVENYSMSDRAYINAQSEFVAAQTSISINDSQSVDYIQTNTYTYSEPQLVSLGNGKQLLTWIDDDNARSSANRTSLKYSYFDGASWTTPQWVQDDGTADFSAKLKVVNGLPYLVWQNAKTTFADADSLGTVASAMEINVATFDSSSQTFVGITRLTDNDTLDMMPDIGANGTDAMLAWVNNAENDLFGISGRNEIFASTFNGTSWSAAASMYADLNSIDSLAIGSIGGEKAIAYAMDTDGDIFTPNDVELYVNGDALTSNDVPDLKPIISNNVLYWYCNGQVQSKSDLGDAPTLSLLPDGVSIATDRFEVLNNANGDSYILFNNGDGMNSEVGVYYYDKKSGAYSPANSVSSLNRYIDSFNGYLNDDGSLSLAVNARTVNTDDTLNPFGQADLGVVNISKYCDYAIDNVYLDSSTLNAGATIPIYYDVTNKGTFVADSISLEVRDEKGKLIQAKNANVRILPGETEEMVLYYTLPSDFVELQPHHLTFAIVPSSGNDVNQDNNSATVSVNYIDASVEDVAYGVTEDNQLIVYAGIANRGLKEIRNVKVNLTDASRERNVLESYTIDSIDTLDSKTVSFAHDIERNESYFVIIEPLDDESMTANNDAYIDVVLSGTTVAFDSAGGSAVNNTIFRRTGTTYGTLPVFPTMVGYTCTGWYTSTNGDVKVDSKTVLVSEEDHTLYAHWKKDEIKTPTPAAIYAVTYNANTGKGTAPAKQSAESGKSVTVAANKFTKTNWTFTGWNTKADGKGTAYKVGDSLKLTKDVTLYAQWKENAKYTVTFNANGGKIGTATTVKKSIIYASKYTLPAEPKRTGYTFVAWYTETKGGSKVTKTTDMKTAKAHTLYARWTPNKYSVTYDAVGGKIGKVKTVKKTVTFATKYAPPATPKRTGYTFVAWYTAKTKGGSKVTKATVLKTAKAHTIYARWTPNKYTVTYNANGGKIGNAKTAKKTVTFAKKYALPATPKRAGYTFKGWYTKTKGGTQVSKTTKLSNAKSHTLYARWAKK